MPPAGFKRSRALWEQARESKHGLWRAVLYELQPVRQSELTSVTDSVRTFCVDLVRGGQRVGTETIPAALVHAVRFVQGLTLGQWKGVGIAVAYYVFVRWVHAKLDAGPLVLILSALVAIFTIGLSDNADGGLSAYSVFNKGFQKLLGSVDEDALLQQHVGGGLLGLGGRVPLDAAEDNQGRIAAAPLRRNQQQHRQDQLLLPNEQPDQALLQPEPVPRARRTGKKARRGDQAMAQRRELRAQREAAMALGFGGNDGGGGGGVDENDQAAILRLLDHDAAERDE